MGYKTLTASQMDNLKKINDGVNKSFSESANEENAVLGLLKLFYETNARN